MRQSTFPLELELGMQYYASETDGIGGRLRATPDDFIVDEIPKKDWSTTAGPYLICRLTKNNWELQHAIKEIARRLAISHRRIGWAGTKDKNAITTQLISLYDVTPAAVADIRLKDIRLDVVGQANEQLSLGDLAGNRFDLVIRNVDRDQLRSRVDETAAIAKTALPNYFGLQRFGVIRPLTHRIGECILHGDYECAVVMYIGEAFPHEREDIQKIRTAYKDSRDANEALRQLPQSFAFERSMLHHLYNHQGDHAGALQQLPPKLLSMFVSAFQSYLFNRALSHRIEDGNTLTEPVPGDRLLFTNGRTDVVTSQNIPAVALHIARNRCSIALFMPGKDPADRTTGNDAMTEILEEVQVTHEDFRRAATFVHTKFDGAWRPIALSTAIETDVQDDTVRLRFSLPPGHYATTVCREFMKADPLQMV
ncbi:MAG: tRNA pseudouridine(13) synthase TruD [Methanoregula sp.]|nr:tRNA pseudouridine(13) synthase TruD [Methanoregula sp.]